MTTETRPTLVGLHHLKYPVSDLDKSLDWWERAFGAERQPASDHHTLDGVLFAYMLLVPGLDPPLELRLAPGAAEAMAGFDPLVFAAADQVSFLNGCTTSTGWALRTRGSCAASSAGWWS